MERSIPFNNEGIEKFIKTGDKSPFQKGGFDYRGLEGHPLDIAPFVLRSPSMIDRRQWLYDRHLIRGFVSLTVGPGGLGKTSFITTEVLAMCTGKPLLGKSPDHPLKVFLWSGEDPAAEAERRISAACSYYSINQLDLAERLFVSSGRELQIKIANVDRGGPTPSEPTIKHLVQTLQEKEIDVLVVDPLICTHSLPENDTAAMSVVMDAWRRIADEADCAVELVHHVNKSAALDGDMQGIQGSRGAGAVIDAVRSARYLVRIPEEMGRRLGLRPEEIGSTFSVKIGKANLGPHKGQAWHQIVGFNLGNGTHPGDPGDEVGVCVQWTPPRPADDLTTEQIQAIKEALSKQPAMRASERSICWAGYAIAEIIKADIGAPGSVKADRSPDQERERSKAKGILRQLIAKGILKVIQSHDGRTGRDVKVVTANVSTGDREQLHTGNECGG